MRVIKTSIGCFALSAFCATALAQVPETTYDGVWNGNWTCSEHVKLAGPRPNGFTDRITFFVKSKVGSAAYENETLASRWSFRIGQDSSISMDASGVRKQNTHMSWSIRGAGRVTGDKIEMSGPMRGNEGEIVRTSCTFQLQNGLVQARLDELNKPRPQVAVASALVQEAAPQPKPATEPKPTSKPAKAVYTPPPEPVAATPRAPARTAAIANVDISSGDRGMAKVTTNPADAVKKTGANDVWINFNPSITVQERQFCRLVENFRAEHRAAEQSRNQIKVNEAKKNFSQAINAFLPDGKFQGWVMRSVLVAQANDGSADVLFELPCNVFVGSNTCDPNPKNYYGTVPENSRVYSELAKMTVNDFALVSGSFVYTDDKAFDRTRSVVSYGYLKPAAHCNSKVMPASADFFGTTISVLSTIK